MSITVITPTNRESNMNNIIENFLRQNFETKELIILLNYCNPNENLWSNAINNYNNISFYNLGSRTSLGNCLNFGISKSKYEYIAKMDDDDYYGPKYLTRALNTLSRIKADMVGKKSMYIYFEDEKILGLRYSSDENRYVNRVAGSTLFFRKEVCGLVQFKDKNLGEDREFCKDLIRKGFKIFSTDSSDYIYIRKNNTSHTWKIDNAYLIRKCIYINKTPDINEFIKGWQV